VRSVLLPYIAWLGALKSLNFPSIGLADTARLFAIAGALASLSVLVYRLGVWRQEMENTKQNVAAEVKAHREEAAVHFDRMERRLEAIDHLIGVASEERMRVARWRARTERRPGTSRTPGDPARAVRPTLRLEWSTA
jgi:hypothetical protein